MVGEREFAVELDRVSKRFGGVRALSSVDLSVEQGTVHALVGENGAGKSTLGKIVAGVLSHDEGEVRVRGRPVRYRSPRDALADGVTIIAQELLLVPLMTVIENVFLGIENPRLGGITDTRLLNRRYAELERTVGFGLPPSTQVRRLRVADQQKVEILRALARKADVLIMDEPTAALSKVETTGLFETIKRLKQQGQTILYISHSLDDVLALADSVTVLRDGYVVRTSAAKDETPSSLVAAMIGRSLGLAFPPKQFPSVDAPVVLEVDGLSRSGAIHDLSFMIRAGEILGLAGLIGSGRSEVARAVFGADGRDRGQIRLNGKTLGIRHPRDAVRSGIAMVPESRKSQGLLMQQSVASNITLPHLTRVTRAHFVSTRRERTAALQAMREVDVRPPVPSRLVGALSGGNQQKTLFGKWLLRRPHILIADEPTRGVDVGAKHAIYTLLAQLAAAGMAVLLISSELEEVIGLAHRVLVLRHGRLVAELEGNEIAEELVTRAAFGANRENVAVT